MHTDTHYTGMSTTDSRVTLNVYKLNVHKRYHAQLRLGKLDLLFHISLRIRMWAGGHYSLFKNYIHSANLQVLRPLKVGVSLLGRTVEVAGRRGSGRWCETIKLVCPLQFQAINILVFNMEQHSKAMHVFTWLTDMRQIVLKYNGYHQL